MTDTPSDEEIALYDAYAAWEAEHEPDLSEALFAMAVECWDDDAAAGVSVLSQDAEDK